ncbi:MAG TPA: hypothetical protein V6D20_20805 [Candidatus Obscuribacterales bacterium]
MVDLAAAIAVADCPDPDLRSQTSIVQVFVKGRVYEPSISKNTLAPSLVAVHYHGDRLRGRDRDRVVDL